MLVGAFACAHTPQLLIRPPTEDRDLVLRVHAAFARVKQRIEALAPDVIAIVAGDHVEAFFLDGVPALAVYAGAECAGTFGSYRYRFPIHEPLARAVVEQGIARGFDLLYTQSAALDYAFYVPLHFTMPAPAVPILPCTSTSTSRPSADPPLPCLGQSTRRDPARPAGAGRADGLWRPVALPAPTLRLAGLRYEPASARAARGGARRRAGRGHGGGARPGGQYRLRTWITLLGAVGAVPAQVYCYEPSWHHGNAVVEWPL